jgi:hypothetical protein
MLQVTMTNRGGTDHERAVSNCFCYRFVFCCAGQDGRCAHGGTSILKSHIVWIHHSQVLKSKVAHRASGCSDVERIARIHEDDAQTVEFNRDGQVVCL